ncbi:condensation domain-containing protein, partial [Streptomyces halstedii]|uniref:condensation domain-containing protein n=1 Tax=Streptomyces halstedii TaxID=1944 RepID=UPI0037F58969
QSNGIPEQRILPSGDLPSLLTVVDATSWSQAELDTAVAGAAGYAFDLAGELPLRATLFTTGPQECVLLLVMHHIAGDGWSMGPLARDLSTAYSARVNNTEPSWTPLPVQYADYTLWQRELLGDDNDPDSVAGQQLAYWRKTLADSPEELLLPTDRPRPATPTHHGATIPLDIPAELHQHLTDLARTHNATMFMVLQAALATLLSKLGAGQDIPIGTPIAGRTDENLNDLVGFFVNTLVLRTDLEGDPTFTQLLTRVREQSLTAYAHQDIPFERLVEDLAPTRSMARHPLFQVMLTLQNNQQATLDLPGLATQPVTATELPAKFDLDLHISEQFGPDGQPAGLTTTLTYTTDLYDPETVNGFARRFTHVLQQITAHPHTPVSHITLLDKEEQHQVLEEWNRTDVEVPSVTLPELFQTQAAQTPEATAVVFAGDEISYGELNARANRLARLLIQHGV